MKNILFTLLILINFNSFSQQEVDLTALNTDIGLGDGFSGIEIDCNAQTEYNFFTNEDAVLNGHVVYVYGSDLTINGDVYFGGAFLGYCESTLTINGTVIFGDPQDPGGNPFDLPDGTPMETEDIPNIFNISGTFDMPEGIYINYATLYAMAENQNKLIVETYTYDKVINILEIENADIKVYNLLGQLLLEGNSILDLSTLDDAILIIKTEQSTFKLAL